MRDAGELTELRDAFGAKAAALLFRLRWSVLRTLGGGALSRLAAALGVPLT